MSREILIIGLRVFAFLLVLLIVWRALLLLRTLLIKDQHVNRNKHRSGTSKNAPLSSASSRNRASGAKTPDKTSRRARGFLARRRPRVTPDDDLPNAPSADLPLVIMARFGGSFSAGDIENLVNTFGLRRSPAGVYELLNENGRDLLFTMSDIDGSGTFPEVWEEKYKINGLLFVMHLPNGHDAVKSCETFSALIREMTETCDGRLCDFRRRPMENKGLMAYRAAAEQFQHEYDAWLAHFQRGS